MNIIDAIRNRVLKFLRLDKLNSNPYGERLTYISNDEDIIKQNLQAYKVWYTGDSSELLNFYTNQQIYGNAREPIYNRNKMNYFWGLSSIEQNIKRVHSGIPNAIVTTLVNVLGIPQISITDNPEKQALLDKILEKNDFANLVNQQQMPMTLVEGWGAFKVNFDKDMSDVVNIQYYEGEDVEFVSKMGMIIGIIYKDYYQYKDKNYILLETRRISNEGSHVEYELYKQETDNDITPVELSTIPELAELKDIIIPNYKHILGVPSKFFYDTLNKNYGKSIFAGKTDLFDDLDQDLSQCSQTVRVSTPVEYYPVDLLERQANGQPKMPKVYNRQYVEYEGLTDGDGNKDGRIYTTQPELNYEGYSANAKAILDFILTGLLSPATMGIDVAKKDNADAQREKEKVTIMTRNNIINRQERIYKELMNVCLAVQEYMDTGAITIEDYDINVKFNEFANPSFENEIQVLGSAWSNGEISTEKYVDLLWGDKLSDAEKEKEIAWLDDNRKQDNLQFGDVEDVQSIRTELPEETEDNQEFNENE